MPDYVTIEELIRGLSYRIAAGRSHLTVALGLSESDPVVLNAANVFFAMTIDAHLYSSLMYAARLHDDQRKAATIRTLLDWASERAESAKHGTKDEVEQAIAKARTLLLELEEPLRRLDKLRNRRLAHTDPRTITDPKFAAFETEEAAKDLKEIYEKTATMVNLFGHVFNNTYSDTKIIGEDDYEAVVGFISDGKCRQAKQYESEFHEPAPFPKPKNCV